MYRLRFRLSRIFVIKSAFICIFSKFFCCCCCWKIGWVDQRRRKLIRILTKYLLIDRKINRSNFMMPGKHYNSIYCEWIINRPTIAFCFWYDLVCEWRFCFCSIFLFFRILWTSQWETRQNKERKKERKRSLRCNTMILKN